jgi:hypothetical protein
MEFAASLDPGIGIWLSRQSETSVIDGFHE